jgi:hypothetical protein
MEIAAQLVQLEPDAVVGWSSLFPIELPLR